LCHCIALIEMRPPAEGDHGLTRKESHFKKAGMPWDMGYGEIWYVLVVKANSLGDGLGYRGPTAPQDNTQ
ncbi:MAG: hypothetical protein Q8P59_12685, partial [Dehalococcoidia bacterium]|nr:hypothetical protein [Dehalococcoidia bacterium]